MATFPDSPGSGVVSICPSPVRSVCSSDPCKTTADNPSRGIDSSARGVPVSSTTDGRVVAGSGKDLVVLLKQELEPSTRASHARTAGRCMRRSRRLRTTRALRRQRSPTGTPTVAEGECAPGRSGRSVLHRQPSSEKGPDGLLREQVTSGVGRSRRLCTCVIRVRALVDGRTSQEQDLRSAQRVRGGNQRKRARRVRKLLLSGSTPVVATGAGVSTMMASSSGAGAGASTFGGAGAGLTMATRGV